MDLIDLDLQRKSNIQVFHAGEGNRDAVAEHALGMLLGLLANIVKADKEVSNGDLGPGRKQGSGADEKNGWIDWLWE